MQLDTGNRFAKFTLTDQEDKVARSPTPYFLAYLQNKIADYASAAVELQWKEGETAEQTLRQHERLKAQVEILEELLRELTIPTEQDAHSSNPA